MRRITWLIKYILFGIVFLFITGGGTWAQYQISSHPVTFNMFYNPAYNSIYSSGLGLNYRNHWPGSPMQFNRYFFSVSLPVEGQNASVGLVISSQNQQSVFQELQLEGSFSKRINITQHQIISGALSLGIYQFRNNFSGLTTENQEFLNGDHGILPIAGVGFLYHNHKFMAGAAFKNYKIVKYNLDRSFFNGYLNFMASNTFEWQQLGATRSKISITPRIIWEKYAINSMITIGSTVFYSPLELGLFLKNDVRMNNNYPVYTLGYVNKGYKLMYSYDGHSFFGGGIINYTGHEVTFLYLFKYKDQKRGAVPCPDFYNF